MLCGVEARVSLHLRASSGTLCVESVTNDSPFRRNCASGIPTSLVPFRIVRVRNRDRIMLLYPLTQLSLLFSHPDLFILNSKVLFASVAVFHFLSHATRLYTPLCRSVRPSHFTFFGIFGFTAPAQMIW